MRGTLRELGLAESPPHPGSRVPVQLKAIMVQRDAALAAYFALK
jgi:hypothetical protein